MSRLPSPRVQVALLSLVMGAWGSPLSALPISFGINQGPLKYSETKNDHFYIYHDSRSPTEGAIALESLEHAKPLLEKWIGVEREGGLPVVVSDVTSGASFANFITDTLEVQTGGLAARDLFLHEYVHSSMYRHFDWMFGPPGAVLHLPWMPAWFIEGLAESLSVSVGSDVQGGIERYQALAGDWPTYDRLHSLYGKYNFALRGYATSGGLVSYILRQGDPTKLPRLLSDFYAYTKPWWWVWAAVPFNGFMPMDRVLEDYAKFDGRTLYERYKKDAAAYWKGKAPSPLLVKQPGVKRDFSGFFGFQSVGADLRFFVRVNDRMEDHLLESGKSGWVEKSKKINLLPADFKSGIGFFSKDIQVVADNDVSNRNIVTPGLKVRLKDGKSSNSFRFRPNGFVNDIWDTPDAVLWWEQGLTKTSICFLLKQDLLQERKRPTCSLTLEQPKSLEFLGARLVPQPNKDVHAKELWFNIVEQTLAGEKSQILVFDATERRLRTLDTTAVGRPIAAAFSGNGIWILSAERGSRTIRKIEGDGKCIGMMTPSDHILAMWGQTDGSLALGLYAGKTNHILRVPSDSLKLSSCATPTFQSSPLMAAMSASGEPMTLSDALKKSSYWASGTAVSGSLAPNSAKTVGGKEAAVAGSAAAEQEAIRAQALIQDAAPLGEGVKNTDATYGPAKWRGRPVLLGLPWIGGDDAYGSQVGVISLPLMDHMQNDTVRATFLYGTNSRFPNSEVSYLSTRFWPTLKLDAFRAQTFNGVVTYTNGKQEVLYYDEKGVRGSISWNLPKASFDLGLKAANLEPYIGPTNVRQGNIREVRGAVSTGQKVFSGILWSNNLYGNVIPQTINEEFDYNQLGFNTGLSKDIALFASNLSLGLESSRTRGAKPRFLKEIYRPLKTFVPGSGGGYNKNSYGLIGAGSLFSGKYGDTQGRASANWVIPIIPDFDKLLWIFYIERLDLTAFVNYGGAWNQRPLPYKNELIAAHGYNFDLQFDLKGIRFNLGLGAGQVFGDNLEIYFTSGFDAIF